jgi:hypothetical protein
MKTMMLFSPDTMKAPFVRFIIDSANGHFWRGLLKFLSGKKQGN